MNAFRLTVPMTDGLAVNERIFYEGGFYRIVQVIDGETLRVLREADPSQWRVVYAATHEPLPNWGTAAAIVRDLAAHPPDGGGYLDRACAFCGASFEAVGGDQIPTEPDQHRADCLWRRAREAVEHSTPARCEAISAFSAPGQPIQCTKPAGHEGGHADLIGQYGRETSGWVTCQ